MWQRIQTVFLALLILCLVAGLFFPIWIGYEGTEITKMLLPMQYTVFGPDGPENQYFPYCLTSIFMAAAATIAVIEIRKYNDRILQIKLGTLNSLVLMLMMISAVWFANKMVDANPSNWKYGWGLYIPFAGVAFNWLAVRFIRRDEKKVRDADRIR